MQVLEGTVESLTAPATSISIRHVLIRLLIHIQELLDAVDAGDAQAFTDAVANWDRLSKLDSWKTTLLLKIKKSISEEVDFT